MIDTTFMDNVVFPLHISWGSSGGPDWIADIVSKGSGFEERNTAWSAPLRYYDARYGVRDHDELYEILELYHAAMGRMRGFRLLDWTDYRSGKPQAVPTELDQSLGTGDGSTQAFNLVKRYEVLGHTFDRRINKPFDNILVAVDGTAVTEGVEYSVNLGTGVITFTSGNIPGIGMALTWGGQFHVPARFDGSLEQTAIRGPIGDIPSIPLKELRL